MLKKFISFIEKEDLIRPGQTALLAVSGGSDSVALCELFHQAGFRFGIAHCNFRLRGKESDKEALFVRNLAGFYNVAYFEKDFDTAAYAKEHTLSLQMAARELRYSWFETVREAGGYDMVATGHHLDDMVETFMINLARGTGISGLRGIQPRMNHLIRPLLFAEKKDITAFVNENKLAFMEDSSNFTDKYNRNKIRLRVLPVLQEINPEFVTVMQKNMDNLRDTEMIYHDKIEDERQKHVLVLEDKVLIPIAMLRKLSPLRTYLFEFLSRYGFSSVVTDEVLAALGSIPGKVFYSSTHHLLRDRDELVITPIPKEALLTEPSEYFVQAHQKTLDRPIRLEMTTLDRTGDYIVARSKSIASLDYEKLRFPLKIRRWSRGDRFVPMGLASKQKLSDFFIDRKFSLIQKANTWLLCSGDDIAWVIGHRIDDRYKVTDTTKLVLQIRLIG